uniref:Cytochrome P450 3A n=1 Tax=Astyanax mexicanus TaxID=7994 RepID=A0A3B1JWT7_ASTMX
MSLFSYLSITWSLVVLAVTLLYGVWPHGFFKKLGIPGPKPWPFFGTFLSYIKGFHNFDTDCYKKYGKVWGIYDGRLPILMVLDPEMIKSIMVKDCYSVFTNRRMIGPFSDRLTVVKDEKWKRIRGSLSPFFTSGRLKEKYGDRFIENLKKRSPDDPVQIKDVFAPFSMDVVASASFSVDIDSINNPDEPFAAHFKNIFNFSFFSPLLLILTLFPSAAGLLGKVGFKTFSKSDLEFFYTSLKKLKEQHNNMNHVSIQKYLYLIYTDVKYNHNINTTSWVLHLLSGHCVDW